VHRQVLGSHGGVQVGSGVHGQVHGRHGGVHGYKDRNIENESFVQCLELKVHLRAFFDILSNLGNSYPDYDLATARALLVKH
jgi:hypothetical protein